MRIVLDTDVMVSGILSPNGPPAAILRTVLMERVVVCFDERILAEYRDVLTRGRFGCDSELVSDLLDFLETAGESTLAAPLKLQLPDQADVMFIEVAVAAAVDSLVTGDTRQFPAKQRRGTEVVTPRGFLDRLPEG